jgi:hypothetical protein
MPPGCDAGPVGDPMGDSRADLLHRLRRVFFPWCEQEIQAPCVHDPEGDHVMRWFRARGKGLVSEDELAAAMTRIRVTADGSRMVLVHGRRTRS